MANYDAPRQAQMRAALDIIRQGAESNDLKEVVDKAL